VPELWRYAGSLRWFDAMEYADDTRQVEGPAAVDRDQIFGLTIKCLDFAPRVNERFRRTGFFGGAVRSASIAG
jgi:hypothetical protein